MNRDQLASDITAYFETGDARPLRKAYGQEIVSALEARRRHAPIMTDSIVSAITNAMFALFGDAQKDVRMAGLKYTLQTISERINQLMGQPEDEMDWLAIHDKAIELEEFVFTLLLFAEQRLSEDE